MEGALFEFVPAPSPRDGMVFIYALVDPRYDTVRYIGRTTNLAQRYHAHMNFCDYVDGKYEWACELRSLGMTFLMYVIEEATSVEAGSAEIRWIRHFREKGEPLFNTTSPLYGQAGCTGK